MDPYRCGLPVAMTFLAAGSVAVAAGTATLITLAAKALLTRH